MISVISVVTRAGWRSGRRSFLVLATVVGLVVLTTVSAAAGARRTATTVDRLLEETSARDVEIQVDDDEVVDAVLGAVERMEDVTATGRVRIFPVLPDRGGSEGSVDFVVHTSPDGGLGERVDRGLLLSGRRPDPRAIEEVAINEVAARRAGVEVGERFEASTFTAADLEQMFSGEGFPGFNGPRVAFEVVGIIRIAADLSGSDTEVGAVLYAGPAFAQRYQEEAGSLGGMMAVRLSPGASVDDVAEVARRAGGADAELFVDSVTYESARDAVGVVANALWVLAAVAAVGGTVIVAGSVAREAARTSATGRALRSLGLTRVEAVRMTALPIALAAAAGAVLGVAGSVVVSAYVPFGFARRAEPDGGPLLDVPVALVAAAVLAIVVVAAVAVAGVASPRAALPRTSRVADRLSAVLSLPAIVGVRWALEPRRGRAVANRSAMAGSVLAVVGVSAALSFVASLDAVREDPRRYGWAWSAEPDVMEGSVPDLAQDLANSGLLDGVAIVHGRTIEFAGEQTAAVAIEEVGGSVPPVILSGREPTGPDEIALGEVTARALDVSIGDTVAAVSPAGDSTLDLSVVGYSVFRDGESPEPGRGALLTLEGLDAVSRSEGFVSLGVVYPEGVEAAVVEQQLRDRFPVDYSVYSRPRLPGVLANLGLVVPVVGALVAFFVLLGLVAVGHASAVSARVGRRDLAVLRSLGMIRRRASGVLGAHAVTVGVVGVVVGAPLGVAIGRMVWTVLVGSEGIIDEPTTPVTLLVVVVIAAVSGHWILGRAAGARRWSLAAVLRQE